MTPITTKVIERIEEIKKEIQHLQRPNFYESFAESFEEREEQVIPEDLVNNLVDRLTIRTFNEELKAVFPFIYKLIDESELPVREIDPDEILGEELMHKVSCSQCGKGFERSKKEGYSHCRDHKGKSPIDESLVNEGMCPDCYKDPCECDNYDDSIRKESFDPEIAFETFIENIVNEDKNEIFSPNKTSKLRAINKLNQIFSSELKGGPGGVNAIESLKGLIDDPGLVDELQSADPNLDVRPIVQQFLLDNPDKFPGSAAETMALINFSGEGEVPVAAEPAPIAAPETEPAPMAAPETEPAPMAAPETEPAPMAESLQDSRMLRLKEKLSQACECGATLETILEFGHSTMTMHDAIEQCGFKVEDFGFVNPEVNGLEEMLKYVSGFYNKNESNFPLGGERIKIKVKKGFEDGEFPNASPEDLHKVLRFIELKDQGRAEPQIAQEPLLDPKELKLHELMSDIKRLAGI